MFGHWTLVSFFWAYDSLSTEILFLSIIRMFKTDHHLKNYQFQLKKMRSLIRWVYCIFWRIQLIIIINAGRLNSLQFVNDLSEVIDTPFSIAKKKNGRDIQIGCYVILNVLCQCQKWCIRSWLSDSSGNSAAYLFVRRLKHVWLQWDVKNGIFCLRLSTYWKRN